MLPTSNRHEKKQKNALYNKSMGPFIVAFTVLMPTCCVILEYFYFDLNLEGFEYKVQTSALFFIYFMSMWSYYQAVVIKNDTIKKDPPTADNRDIDPLYKNNSSCLQCNKWKPIRTHHCSICGTCIAKMDHHCPWINNCVGLRNHRSFYLFTLYMTLGGVQYAWRSWVFFSQLYFSDNFFSESTAFYLFWGFTSVVLYPTAMMLSFLFFYHSMLIMTNQTTLEQMKNTHSQGCFPNRYEQPKYINVFDRGWIANVAWFFNYSWLWWMPFENIYETDGTTFPISPLCTIEDVKQIAPEKFDSLPISHQIDMDQMSEDAKKYIENVRQKFRGKRMIVNDQVVIIE